MFIEMLGGEESIGLPSISGHLCGNLCRLSCTVFVSRPFSRGEGWGSGGRGLFLQIIWFFLLAKTQRIVRPRAKGLLVVWLLSLTLVTR